jgi:hypothetical protein
MDMLPIQSSFGMAISLGKSEQKSCGWAVAKSEAPLTKTRWFILVEIPLFCLGFNHPGMVVQDFAAIHSMLNLLS